MACLNRVGWGKFIGMAAILALFGVCLPNDRTALADGPAIRRVDCWFKVPADHKVSCYRIQVPEQRSAALSVDPSSAGGRQSPGNLTGAAGRARAPLGSSSVGPSSKRMMLDLPVVVISTPKDRQHDDAVVYLSGGPGDGDWVDADRIGYWWTYLADNPWLRHRDLVLFDQRGVGMTEPRADCPELAALNIRGLTFGNDHARSEAAERDAGKACLARLYREGHDPAAYTTAASAADLHDIFHALGLPRWNVYGLSYGTRLGLTYMRDFPDDIRSVILDSVYPPQIHFLEDDAWRTDRAFRMILDGCAQDRHCRGWYPDLAGRLQRLVDRLNGSPLPIDTRDPNTGAPLHFDFTGETLLGHLFFNMYNRRDIERVPQIIDIFDRNLTRQIKPEIDDLLANVNDRPDWGDAMATTIDCLEDTAFNDLDKTRANYRAYPLLREFAEDDPAPVCPVWVQQPPDRRLTQPVSSTLPALILTGVYDPVTPPQYARLASASLINSFYFEFQGIGHDVLGNDDCAGRLADAFLDRPSQAPTDRCLGGLSPPDFEPPAD